MVKEEKPRKVIPVEHVRSLILHFMSLGDTRTKSIARVATILKIKPADVRFALK